MKIQTMIMLGGGEKYIINRLNEALNLVGWHEDRNREFPALNDMTKDEQRLYDEIKALRRVRSDQFSMQDVKLSERYIRRKAAELVEKADAGGVFGDAKLDSIHSDGVRSSAQLGLRRLQSFLDQLQEYIDEYNGVPA